MTHLCNFSYFDLYPYYGTLSTAVVSEYFINDLSSVLTAIGGNLGLFLGYSTMTILLSIVEVFKLSWKKYASHKKMNNSK